jgi:4-amino-4-deoxy-L-arabinose transferase-like glycosyltransferase
MLRILHTHKRVLLLLLGIFVLYFLLRLPNLTLQPIFADEAIYIRWAQIMRSEPSLRFLPLSDGKTPLFMWMMMPMFKIFSDPLLAGRILSVFMGSLTVLGAFVLGVRLKNTWVGLLAAFLVTVTPYMVFFDRMALVDSTLAAFTIWIVITAIYLVSSRRLDVAMVLGYLLGGALLTKTPASFNFITVPLTLLLFDFKSKLRGQNIIRLLGLWGIAGIISMGMYNILRLGPNFQSLSSRNQDYVRSPWEVMRHPLDPFLPHLGDIFDWYPALLTWPILICIVAGIIMVIKDRNRVGLVSLGWVLVPFLALTALLQTFTARYLLPQIPLLLVLGAYGGYYLYLEAAARLPQFKKPQICGVLMALIIVQPSFFIAHLLTNPEKTPLPRAERIGYFEDWTAGYGLKEVADYLTLRSLVEPVVVGTAGSFGTLPDGLWIYLDKTTNVTIKGGGNEVSEDLISTAQDHPTFFLIDKYRYNKPSAYLRLIKEYPKAASPDGKQDALMLFEVLPEAVVAMR